MMNLSLKNVPDELYQRLRDRAQDHRRSLNSEILFTLEQATKSVPIDPEDFLKRVASIQVKIKGPPLTDEFIRTAKEVGRR